MGENQIKKQHKLYPDGRVSRPQFGSRLSEAAKELEEQAWQLPPGSERDALLKKARKANVAEHLQNWAGSTGLQPPK